MYRVGYAFSLRRSIPAIPSTPEPKSARLVGSGTGVSLKATCDISVMFE